MQTSRVQYKLQTIEHSFMQILNVISKIAMDSTIALIQIQHNPCK